MSGESSTPSSRNTSRSTSPVDDASWTIRLASPKRVLSWWWSMSIVYGASWRTSGSGPRRLSFAQSTATSTRSDASAGTSRLSSSSGMKPYSCGSGAGPARYMNAFLPSARSARVIASSDPSASPSGFSWVVTRKRSWARSTSTTRSRSARFVVVVSDELIDQPRHADAVFDRGIVVKGQLRSPLQSELLRQPRLEHAVGRREPLERARALAVRAENADEDVRLAEVGRRTDARDRHEPDPRILQLSHRLRQHGPDRFVHATHAFGHFVTNLARASSSRLLSAHAADCRNRPASPARRRRGVGRAGLAFRGARAPAATRVLQRGRLRAPGACVPVERVRRAILPRDRRPRRRRAEYPAPAPRGDVRPGAGDMDGEDDRPAGADGRVHGRPGRDDLPALPPHLRCVPGVRAVRRDAPCEAAHARPRAHRARRLSRDLARCARRTRVRLHGDSPGGGSNRRARLPDLRRVESAHTRGGRRLG